MEIIYTVPKVIAGCITDSPDDGGFYFELVQSNGMTWPTGPTKIFKTQHQARAAMLRRAKDVRDDISAGRR